MELIDRLMMTENEVIGLIAEINLEDYLEKYLGIYDHDQFTFFTSRHAAHQVAFEIETGTHINYINSLCEAFLMGFLMGHMFREREGHVETNKT